MPTFEVKDANGVLVHRYRHTAKIDYEQYPEPPFVQTEIADPIAEEEQAPTVYGGRRVLSKLEFLRLFTQEERITLKQFSKGNSPAAHAVEDYMFLLELSQEVDLDFPDTQAGVMGLEAAGLLGSGRAQEILHG